MGEVAEYIDQFEVSPLVIKQLLQIAKTYPEYSVEASKIAIKLICDRRSIFKNYLIFKDHTNLSVFQNILKEKAESGDNDSISILNQLNTQISESFNNNYRQTGTTTALVTFNNSTPLLKFSNIEDYYDSLLDSYRRLPVTLKSFKEIQEVLKRRSIDILMITGPSSQLNDNMVFYYNINPKYLKFFKKYQFKELELIMIYKFYDDRFITMIEYFRKRLEVLFEVATSTGRSIDGNRDENDTNPYGNYGDYDLDDDDDDEDDVDDDDDNDDNDDDDDDENDDNDGNDDDDDYDMSEYQKNDREGERDSNISDDSNGAINKKNRRNRKKLKKRRNTNDLMNRYGIIDDSGVIDNDNDFATADADDNEEEDVADSTTVSNQQRNKSNKKIGYGDNNRVYQEGGDKIGKDDIISNDEVISYFNCKWVIIYGYFSICDYNSVVKLFNKLIKSNPINNITAINVLQDHFHNFVVTPKVLMRCIILSFLITKSTSELIVNLNTNKLLKNCLIEDKLLNELISNYINCKFKKFKLKIKELLINNENKFNFNFFKNSVLIFKKIINIKIYLIYLSTIDQIKIDHLINKIGYYDDDNDEDGKEDRELVIKELSDIIIIFNLNFKIDLKNGIIKSFNYSYDDILGFTNKLITENNKKLINDSRILEINSMVLQDLK
ncbi:hypothetical protein BVG19_g2899 [[Candida] boidinii]|nr:hypothetical protein BVG19_g2899 [[Candida] boidinii]OWB53709.1 hypothetical protein B5S27_g5317 [[Candida] boidinii]